MGKKILLLVVLSTILLMTNLFAVDLISEGFSSGTAAPTGWTFTSIGGTYTTSGNYGASSPSLKLDATNDRLVTPTFSNPGQLKFWLKGQSTNTSSKLTVEQYYGSAWVLLEDIMPLPSTGTTKTYTLNSTATQVRFTYTRSAGTLAFDDVVITQNAASATITATGTISAYGSVTINTVSSEKSFSVAGSNLTANLLVEAPGGFEVSTTSGSGFASSLTLTPASGTVAATTVYVRFAPTAAQAYSGNIVCSSTGATTANVAVSGTGISPTPAIEIVGDPLTFASTINIASTTQPVGVIGHYLTNTIAVSTADPFQVSTSENGPWATSLSPQLAATYNDFIYVRYNPTAVGTQSGTLSLTSGSANSSLSLSGTASAPNATTISENFTGFTTNNGSSDRSSALNTYLQTTGWTGAAIYEMNGYTKLGASSKKGYITTPALDLSGNGGTAMVQFDLGQYGSDSGKYVQVLLDPGTGTFTQIGSDISIPSNITSQQVIITGGTATSKIRIAAKLASSNRFYLDNVYVGQALRNVTVKSIPSGSAILLDGNDSGFSTPYTFSVSDGSSHTFAVADRNGFTTPDSQTLNNISENTTITFRYTTSSNQVAGNGNGNGTAPVVIDLPTIPVTPVGGGQPIHYNPTFIVVPAIATTEAFSVTVNTTTMPAPLPYPSRFRVYMHLQSAYSGNGDITISIPAEWTGSGYYEVVKYVGSGQGQFGLNYSWIAHYGTGSTWPSNTLTTTLGTWDFNAHTVTIPSQTLIGGRASEEYLLNDGQDSMLPVTLSTFTASVTSQNFAQIMWTTESESNMSGYFLFRSNDNNLTNAQRIDSFVQANNSTQQHTYSFADRSVAQNQTYYYWLQSIDLASVTNFYGPVSVKVGTGNNNPAQPTVPTTTAFTSVFPNPFNPNTIISFQLDKSSPVRIDIFNVKGQLVQTVMNESKAAGKFQVNWNGTDLNGKTCGTGVYYIQMTAGKYQQIKKALLMK